MFTTWNPIFKTLTPSFLSMQPSKIQCFKFVGLAKNVLYMQLASRFQKSPQFGETYEMNGSTSTQSLGTRQKDWGLGLGSLGEGTVNLSVTTTKTNKTF